MIEDVVFGILQPGLVLGELRVVRHMIQDLFFGPVRKGIDLGAVAQNDESPGLHAGSRGGFDGQADEPVHGILADGGVRVLTDAAPVFYGFGDVKHDFFLL